MIKYLGSKRRLVPVLAELAVAARARRALDLFTGTTRVAQAWKRAGVHVTAVDRTALAHTLARCYVAGDAARLDLDALAGAVAELDALPGAPGYVTEVFARTARFFQPHNAERIDAIRAAIAERWAGHPFEPVLLTSLVEAADRVDSTTGVQMAYLKRWAPRSSAPLALRVPELLAGPGEAVRADAVAAATELGPFDLAYLDPPYNQHRYESNYHVWDTIVRGDEPEHYGVACKPVGLRDPASRSAFNERRRMPGALASCIAAVDARVVVVSMSAEGWCSPEEVVTMCAGRGGDVRVLSFDTRRYVGALIGIHNPAGERVGEVSHVRTTEHLVVAGDLRRSGDLLGWLDAQGASVAGAASSTAPRRPGQGVSAGTSGPRVRDRHAPTHTPVA